MGKLKTEVPTDFSKVNICKATVYLIVLAYFVISSSCHQATLSQMKPKPPVNKLAFGKVFTDHMLTIDWSKSKGWESPQIVPFENFSIHPGAKVTN